MDRLLTFLFTDVVGSTPLWEANPEGMHAALARHDAIVREILLAHDGEIVKQTGDGFHAAFASPASAVAAAIAIQQGIAAEAWGEAQPLSVRCGLHTGDSRFRAGDYYGSTLNRAARIMSLGHGGQILISAALHELLKGSDAPFEVRSLGEHRLRGLRAPEQIYQVEHPGLPSSFPPLDSEDAVPHNLPLQATDFVGRERELAALTDRLTATRLLTLLGPGGTGKTRLALELAEQSLHQFADGVYFVDLAALTDGALIADAVAEALGVKEAASEPLAATLARSLADKRTLLVLDNFEHLVAHAGVVGELLAKVPGLTVAVTSREVLHLSGEQVFPVPPLGVPDEADTRDVDALAGFESVQLFLRRAQAVSPQFALTPENAHAVARICTHLDGLPLAIELAAARVRMFPPAKLLERLSDRLRVLTGGARDRHARQRSLRGAIDWSYDLLDPGEQLLFARLEVFSGGMGIEAVEAVCGEDLPIDVIDGLASLLDKSLLARDEDVDGEPRFVLLETLRAYARERHRARDDWRQTLLAHARWALDLAERGEEGMFGPTGTVWVERLRADEGNLRTVLERCRDGELAGDGAEIGVRLAGALRYYWESTGKLGEGIAWLEAALSQAAHLPDAARAKAISGAGVLAYWQGDPDRGARYCGQALEVGRAMGDALIVGEAQHFLAHVAQHHGEADRGVALLTESHHGFLDLGHQWGIRRSRLCLADAHRLLGDYELAERNLRDAVDELRASGEEHDLMVAMLRSNHGNVLNRLGRTDEATESFVDGLRIARDLKNQMLVAYLVDGLAGSAVLGGDAREAAIRMGAAERIFEDLGITSMAAIDQADHEHYLETLRAALESAELDQLWAQGRALTADQTLARMLAR